MESKNDENDAHQEDSCHDSEESIENSWSPTLSKRQIKRGLRYEKLQKYYVEKKQRKKEELKKKKEQEKLLGISKPRNQTVISQEERDFLKEKRNQEHEKRLIEQKTSPRIAIDLDYQSYMRENELSSLSQQVMYCYGAQRRALHPLRLCLFGVTGVLKDKLAKISGFNEWPIERFEQTIDVANDTCSDLKYPSDKIIYLTADSDVELTSLKSDEMYVIGGIVDRNRYKCLALNRANELGYKHAKLPLSLIKFCGSRVLTVNSVMDLLIQFHDTDDWKVAIERSVPVRKLLNENDEEGKQEKVEEGSN